MRATNMASEAAAAAFLQAVSAAVAPGACVAPGPASARPQALLKAGLLPLPPYSPLYSQGPGGWQPRARHVRFLE
jgi:hypothetical protein